MSPVRKILIILSLFLLEASHAFVPTFRASFSVAKWEASASTTLMAKKKRRKRTDNDDAASGSAGPAANAPDADSTESAGANELPDFDLEGPVVEKSAPQGTPRKAASSSAESAPITSAQMGRVKPLSTINELLNDRSLEQEVSFDIPVENAEELPNFSDYVKGGVDQDQPLGKKKARQEARRQAAVAAEEEESGNFFSKLPFIGGGDDDEEKEDLNPVKILEKGTWAGIYILIAWEVYINSPLFNRIGSMAPIVYDTPLPPM